MDVVGCRTGDCCLCWLVLRPPSGPRVAVEDRASSLCRAGADLSRTETALGEVTEEKDRMLKGREEVKKAFRQLKRRYLTDKELSRTRLKREVERSTRYKTAYSDLFARLPQLLSAKRKADKREDAAVRAGKPFGLTASVTERNVCLQKYVHSIGCKT